MILHGVPLSQPFRSVAWACLQKRVPFAVQLAVPGSAGKGGSRSAAYLEAFPSGTVPALQDGPLALTESPAILTYLAEKHGWHDLYPTEPAERALINAVLHWHHTGTRKLAMYFAQHVRPDLAAAMGADALRQQQQAGVAAIGLVESWLLASSPFLAGRAEPSLADLLVVR